MSVVDELERLGFVTRSRNAGDRRRYDLLLTPAGQRALRNAHRAMDVVEVGFFAELSAAQKANLHATLERLLNLG